MIRGRELEAPVVHLEHVEVQRRVLARQDDVLLLPDLGVDEGLHPNLDAGLLLELGDQRPQPGVDVRGHEHEAVDRLPGELPPVEGRSRLGGRRDRDRHRHDHREQELLPADASHGFPPCVLGASTRSLSPRTRPSSRA